MYQTPNAPNVLQEVQVSRTEPVVHVEMVITRVPWIKMTCPLVTVSRIVHNHYIAIS
jgi:hypothetical protein